MDPSVDPTVRAWMRQGFAETTPDQDDLLRELEDTRSAPDWYAVCSLNVLSRLVRLFQARYQGTTVVHTSDSQDIYQALRFDLLRVLPLAGLTQVHDLAARTFPEQITDLDQGGLEQRGEGRQRVIDWLCDHCQQRGLMRYREALTGYFAEVDRRIDAIHFATWVANFPDRKYVPLPPLGQSMAQYIEQARQEMQARRAERKAWDDLPAEYRAMDPALRALTAPQLSLLDALAEARNLCARVDTKLRRAESDIVYEHPADHEDYIILRTRLVKELVQAGCDDLAAWVTAATPARLADIMSGAQGWDSAGMRQLDDRLFQLVTEQGLNPQLDLVIRESLRDDINVRTREIARETQAANARPSLDHNSPVTPSNQAPTVDGRASEMTLDLPAAHLAETAVGATDGSSATASGIAPAPDMTVVPATEEKREYHRPLAIADGNKERVKRKRAGGPGRSATEFDCADFKTYFCEQMQIYSDMGERLPTIKDIVASYFARRLEKTGNTETLIPEVVKGRFDAERAAGIPGREWTPYYGPVCPPSHEGDEDDQ